MEYLLAITACCLGFLAAWFARSRRLSAWQAAAADSERQLTADKAEAMRQLSITRETLRLRTEEAQSLRDSLEAQTRLAADRAVEAAALRTANANLLEQLEHRKQETENLQKRLTTEFENIAGRVLRQRSEEFAASNHQRLGELLNPLKEKIQLFEKKVDETYDKELRDRISLREEVRKLTELNARVSQEANNLTRALKGDVKKQGNWGEVVLERVLERSGLTRGIEYEREEVVEGSEEQRQRPDVIIHLPDNKHIIVDSKVSLVAYERFVSADDEEEKAAHLREHIASLRAHVKELSDKNYQNAQRLNTPDFVLMFLPVEASFSVAVQSDPELFSFAWDRKIVIVCPTTLLATLRTIASIWKQENQTKNAQEIARLGGALYDKFVGFTEDMQKIKGGLDRASASYDEAFKKMCTGQGNIVRTAERIRKLGAKVGSKPLPPGIAEEE